MIQWAGAQAEVRRPIPSLYIDDIFIDNRDITIDLGLKPVESQQPQEQNGCDSCQRQHKQPCLVSYQRPG
jgi:hypothetical protein